MQALFRYLAKGTLKREFASLAFAVWFAIYGYLAIRLPITQLTPDAALTQWGQLAPYIFPLVIAAFGADWVTKETNLAGPPANTQTTVAATVTDDTTTVTTSTESTK